MGAHCTKDLLRKWLVCLVWCLPLALLVTAVSTQLRFRNASREDTIQQQHAILSGEPLKFDGRPAPWADVWRNRILFPLLLKGIVQAGGLNANDAYILARFLTAFAMLASLWWALRYAKLAEERGALAAVAVLSFMQMFVFISYGRESPSDFLDAAFISILTALCLRKQRFATLLVAIFASANRESSAFAGVIWCCLHWRDERGLNFREIAWSAFVCIAAFVATAGLRHWMGATHTADAQAFVLFKGWQHLKVFLSFPTPFGWPVCAVAMLLPPLALIWNRRRQLTSATLSLLLATALITLISMVFGELSELRVFVPSLTLIAIVFGSLVDASDSPAVQGSGPSRS